MSLNSTPRGMRSTIAIIGRTNAGKSSLLNAITDMEVSIVSDISGTTTDAVAKPYELVPVGPVVFYDTAGLDDVSELGQKRIKATDKVLFKSNLALLVCGEQGLGDFEKQTIQKLSELKIPFVVVFNKSDIYTITDEDISYCEKNKIIYIKTNVSDKVSINALKELIIKQIPKDDMTLLSGIVKEKDLIIMVAPIDSEAPKGRLILPQVQAIRDILDKRGIVIVVQPEELSHTISSLNRLPDWVITDSQAVKQVKSLIPEDVKLTTFSILFARLKGDLEVLQKGAKVLDGLQDGAKILIAEACAHHMAGDDIAKVKLPNAIKKYTQKEIGQILAVGGVTLAADADENKHQNAQPFLILQKSILADFIFLKKQLHHFFAKQPHQQKHHGGRRRNADHAQKTALHPALRTRLLDGDDIPLLGGKYVTEFGGFALVFIAFDFRL